MRDGFFPADGWMKMDPDLNHQMHFKKFSGHPFNVTGEFSAVEVPISSWEREKEFCMVLCHRNLSCKSVMTDGGTLCYLLSY